MDIFGEQFNSTNIQKGIDQTNTNYGGRGIASSRVSYHFTYQLLQIVATYSLVPLFFFITRTSFGRGGGVLNIFHDFSLVFSTISAPNTAFGVLLISPKWYPYFPFKQFWNIFLFILDSLQCMINPYIFTT